MISQRKKFAWWRRLLKLFLIMGGAFVLILTLGYLVIRIKFPPDKLKELVAEQLSQALHRRVVIEQASLNPFRGLVLQNFVIYEPEIDSLKAEGTKFVSINKIYLDYTLSSILKRKLVIKEILIDLPEVWLEADREEKWNFSDLIISEVPEDTVLPPPTELKTPLSLSLNQFELRNLSFNLKMALETGTLTTQLAGINGRVTELFIPRGRLPTIKRDVKASLNVFSRNALLQCRLSQEHNPTPLEFGAELNFQFTTRANGIHQIETQGQMRLTQSYIQGWENLGFRGFNKKSLLSNLFTLNLKASADGDRGLFDLEQLQIEMGDELLLQASGWARNLFQEPEVDFRVTKSNVRLIRLQKMAFEVSPPEIRKILNQIKASGEISLQGTTLQGRLTDQGEGISLQGIVSLTDFNLDYARGLAAITDLNFKIITAGSYNLQGLSPMQITGKLTVPRFRFSPDDTLIIEARDGELNLETQLSEQFFPTKIDLTGSLSDLFGSQINLDLRFRSAEQLQKFSTVGELTVKDLNIAQMSDSLARGKAHLEAKLSATSLDKIALDFNLDTQALYVLLEQGWTELPSLGLTGQILIKTDTTFQDFYVTSADFSSGDFFSLKGHGKILNYGQEGFEFIFDQGLLKHEPLLELIPETFMEQLPGLQLSGLTQMKAVLKGRVPSEGEPQYHLAAELKQEDAGLEYPEALLKVAGFTSLSRIQANSDSAWGETEVRIDTVALASVRKMPLLGSTLQLEWDLPRFQELNLNTATLTIPDLKASASVQGKIDSLTTTPQANFLLNFEFSTMDSVQATDDLILTGKTSAEMALQWQPNLAVLSGQVDLSGLNVYFADLFSAYGIRGQFPFSQRVDLEKMELLRGELSGRSFEKIASIGYDILRPYYRNLSPALPQIIIEKIHAVGYEVSDVEMDILLGEGRLEIPRFFLKLYEGNMAGSCWVTLGQGSFDQIEQILDQTEYHLKANISSLNSAKLNPTISAGAGESRINANLALQGRGLNPEGELDFSGYFHITEIGPSVADNLLRSLDLRGTDQGIQSTRNMLKYGFKPRLMSFEIKHGNFYPTIVLSKPWFMPVNLSGGKVELARMPVKFFLKMAMAPKALGD